MRSYGRKKEDRGVLADPGYCSSEASSDDQEGVRRDSMGAISCDSFICDSDAEYQETNKPMKSGRISIHRFSGGGHGRYMSRSGAFTSLLSSVADGSMILTAKEMKRSINPFEKEELLRPNLPYLKEEYNPNDPIFTMTESVAHNKLLRTPNCAACGNDFEYRKRHYCQFCGKSVCSDCLTKKRKMKNHPKKRRYRICDICDQKFFIKDMEEEYGKKIDQKDKEVRDLERGCAEMRTRRIELLGRFNAKKRDVKGKMNEKKKVIRDLERHIARFSKLIDIVMEENDKISDVFNCTQKDIRELEQRNQTYNKKHLKYEDKRKDINDAIMVRRKELQEVDTQLSELGAKLMMQRAKQPRQGGGKHLKPHSNPKYRKRSYDDREEETNLLEQNEGNQYSSGHLIENQGIRRDEKVVQNSACCCNCF